MNVTLLEKMGMGNLDLSYVLIAFLVLFIVMIVMLIVILKKYKQLSNNYAKFMTGNNPESLEDVIQGLCSDNSFLKNEVTNNKKEIHMINKRMKNTFQKIGIVKYDAFKEMGGRLSFCLVLLDEMNDGFILNSVHSSEGCYSYTKTVLGGECTLDLGGEEKEALEMAMNGKK